MRVIKKMQGYDQCSHPIDTHTSHLTTQSVDEHMPQCRKYKEQLDLVQTADKPEAMAALFLVCVVFHHLGCGTWSDSEIEEQAPAFASMNENTFGKYRYEIVRGVMHDLKHKEQK